MSEQQPTDLWIPVLFKGQKVFARCDAAGNPIVASGMVDIRYRANAPKVYRGSARSLEALPAAGAPVAMQAAPAADKEQRPAVASRSKSGSRKKVAGAENNVPKPRPGAIVAYADGACSGNPGPAGSGVVLVLDGQCIEVSIYLGNATNNIAELRAIREALMVIDDPRRPVDIYTDSDYSIGVLTRGWKAKANQELIADLLILVERFDDLRLVWVPGHMGVPLNERADELARRAIEQRGDSRSITPC